MKPLRILALVREGLVRIEHDSNADGRPDQIAHHQGHETARLVEMDLDFDGNVLLVSPGLVDSIGITAQVPIEDLAGFIGSMGPSADEVYAAGEEWTARSDAGTLERGTTVHVTGNDGMVLIVEPLTPSESTEGTA